MTGRAPGPGAPANSSEPRVDLMRELAAGHDGLLRAHWRSRIDQHLRETYAGLRISKFPEDLRTYEHILWERDPQIVIEVGIQFGGSLLYLRDRLQDFRRYRQGPSPVVIGVDVSLEAVRAGLAGLPSDSTAGIELVEGDIADPRVLGAVIQMVPDGAEVFVIEDAAHDAETTLAALQSLAPLVQPGGFYIVEDTCVDIEALRVDEDWPRGAGSALEEWLVTDALGSEFRRRGDLQPYGLTCHPGGLLQRLPSR